MRVLRCPSDIDREINSNPDQAVAELLTRQVEFMSEDESEESLTVVIVEPGASAMTGRYRAASSSGMSRRTNIAVRKDTLC